MDFVYDYEVLDVELVAERAKSSLIPAKSKVKYEKAHKDFKILRDRNGNVICK